MIRRPPSPPPFPYPTLFRSRIEGGAAEAGERRQQTRVGITEHQIQAGASRVLLVDTGSTPLAPAWIWCSVIPTRRSEEHTSELQSHSDLVCSLLLAKKKTERIPWDGLSSPTTRPFHSSFIRLSLLPDAVS